MRREPAPHRRPNPCATIAPPPQAARNGTDAKAAELPAAFTFPADRRRQYRTITTPKPRPSRRVTSRFSGNQNPKPRQAPVIPENAAPRRQHANAITAQPHLKLRPRQRPLNPPGNAPTTGLPVNLASPPEGATPPKAGFPHRRPVLPSQKQQPPQKPPQLTAAFPFPDNARSTLPTITPRRRPPEPEAPPAQHRTETPSPPTRRSQEPSPTR